MAKIVTSRSLDDLHPGGDMSQVTQSKTNTIIARTLAAKLMEHPDRPVAVLCVPGSQIRALWEEQVRSQWLSLYGEGNKPIFDGEVWILESGPRLGLVDG